jgi:hypothetical protein
VGYRIEVRDKDLNRIGEIDTWIQLDIVVQFCDQGSWKLLVKNGTEQAKLLERGGGVAIYQDGVEKPIMTGQIEDFQTYWTTVQHSSQGSVFVGGKSDNKLAFSRLIFPDPFKTVAQQYTSKWDSRTTKDRTATLIWNELNRALGPVAVENRRFPKLRFGGDLGHRPL